MMHARKFLIGLAASAVAVSVLGVTAGPASAVYAADPDDTTYHPGVAADLIGVGSDTSQGVVTDVADAYNLTSPASKIVSYSATGGGTLDLPDASSINRPVGSGAGKNLLYGATNNANIDFARSSSANSTAETQAGLQAFPFAVDTLIMVKSGNVASNAPASLSIAQILDIYKGNVTNWSQVGGSPGVIKPLIPQSGSGTLSFFTAQLTAANGGVAASLAGTVTSVTEHDPGPIQNDPNVIAPFSLAKKIGAGGVGNAVATEPGFSADRAMYNVVRQANVGDAAVTAAFGPNGYFCSATAKPIIEAAGFRQLYPTSRLGVCGAATQSAASNLITADVPTTTTVTVTGATASSARVVAVVSGSTVPFVGSVSFFEGANRVAANIPLVSGRATATVTATPGTHTYTAVYDKGPANSPFIGSTGTGTGTVQKATSSVKAEFPKKVVKGKKVKGTVTVALTGVSAKATGTVTIKLGSKTVGTGTLSNGVVKLKLKGLKVGKNKLTATWAGDTNATGSSVDFKVKITKPKKK
jgi:ABC-type phosphate transport system substrate-binding protein